MPEFRFPVMAEGSTKKSIIDSSYQSSLRLNSNVFQGYSDRGPSDGTCKLFTVLSIRLSSSVVAATATQVTQSAIDAESILS